MGAVSVFLQVRAAVSDPLHCGRIVLVQFGGCRLAHREPTDTGVRKVCQRGKSGDLGVYIRLFHSVCFQVLALDKPSELYQGFLNRDDQGHLPVSRHTRCVSFFICVCHPKPHLH